MPEQIYSYSVKFVCGTQEPTQGCTSVRPGVYATEINIHNFKDTETPIKKYVLPVVLGEHALGREPGFTGPRAEESIVLPPNTATMDDCCRILELLFSFPPPPSFPVTIGFLVIESPQELNVTAVYTATDLRFGFISIDVEQVVGKLK